PRLGCDPFKKYSEAIVFLQIFANELPGQDTSVQQVYKRGIKGFAMKNTEPNNSMKNERTATKVGDLINPQSIAVIGASEDQTKFGGRLFRMLIKHAYQGAIYPINPKRESLFGIKTFPS